MKLGKSPWHRKYETLVKREAETDFRYGKPPQERTVDELLQSCVISFDKQRGPTSHEVAYLVRKILNVEQVGQGGTLEQSGEIPQSPAFYH
ncbi:MAG: hypothetical protein QXF45_00645 [Candidatus Caldarchaeum sp.]